MSHNIFNYDSVAIFTSKVTFTLNKPLYFGMSILDWSKVLRFNVQTPLRLS